MQEQSAKKLANQSEEMLAKAEELFMRAEQETDQEKQQALIDEARMWMERAHEIAEISIDLSEKK